MYIPAWIGFIDLSTAANWSEIDLVTWNLRKFMQILQQLEWDCFDYFENSDRIFIFILINIFNV